MTKSRRWAGLSGGSPKNEIAKNRPHAARP